MHIQRLHHALGELANLTTPDGWTADAREKLATLISDIRAHAAWHNSQVQKVLDHHHPQHQGRHVDRGDLPPNERLAAEFVTFDVRHLADPLALEKDRKEMLEHFDREPLPDDVPVHVALIHDAAVQLLNEVGIYMAGPYYRRTHGLVALVPEHDADNPGTPGSMLGLA